MRILVIDDHALIREALRSVLLEVKGEATVVEAPDWRQAQRELESNAQPDLVLLDLNLPDRDGFEALAELRERYPAVSVAVLSAREDRHSVARAFDFGALGYIPKSARRDVMLSAFNLIFSGGVYIPPEILARSSPAAAPTAPASPGRRVSAADLGLSKRQMDVLALMMQGSSNKAICRTLALAESTVKNHVTAILRALKVSNRTEAVVAAVGLRLDARRSDE